ncbi:MAG TPA: CHAT domain-containing protein, partial [Edaphobacter sp.]|nr:CHAT domain-containing protein [Edaphobacter sp.]
MDQSAARTDWTEAQALARELHDEKWVYRSEGQIGFADYYDGNLAACQKRVSSALIAATAARDIGAQIFYLSATAQGFVAQSLLQEEAVSDAQKAIALAAEHPDVGPPFIANAVLVQALVNLKKVPEAKAFVDKLLQEGHEIPEEEANYEASAAAVAMAQHDPQTAIAYLRRSIEIVGRMDAMRHKADREGELASIYLAVGDLNNAEELARSAVKTLQDFGVPTRLPAKLDLLAQVLIARKKFTEADAVYQEASLLQDMMIGKADTILRKTALITGAQDLYTHHFELVVNHFHDSRRAYNIVEEGRGRAIVDLLVSDRSTSARANATGQRISRLRLQLTNLHSTADIKKQRDALFVAAEQLRSVNPPLTILSTKNFRPIPVEIVQTKLATSETVLEYVISDPTSYCLLLTHDRRVVVPLASKKQIERLIAQYLKSIAEKAPARQEAHALYDMLLAPVQKAHSERDLIIIPDGELSLIPFDALMDDTGQYVLQSQIVTYAPSSTTLYLLRNLPKRKVSGLLAVGGVPYRESGLKEDVTKLGYTAGEFWDLPSSRDEVHAADEALRSASNMVLVGSQATETNVKAAMA